MANIEFEKDGAVAIVTMAKPPHNLIDAQFMDELLGAYRRAQDEQCRALLLRSAMRHFSAGADTTSFGDGGGRRRDNSGLEALWATLEDIPMPTIAAVHGAALGGGLELALTCDMIVAADTASIGMAEASVGLIPLLGGVQRVVQRVGPARTKQMGMFARRHDPATLERWGLVNLVVAEAELATASLSWARQLAAGPTVALGCIKRLANVAARQGSGAADTIQTEVNSVMWASNDQRRGLQAFAATGPASAVFEGN